MFLVPEVIASKALHHAAFFNEDEIQRIDNKKSDSPGKDVG
jgi:hypothetical protein